MKRGLVEDAQLADPGTEVMAQIPAALEAKFDSDRMTQVVNNLLSNARNHGVVGQPVWVTLAHGEADVVLQVSNMAQPISASILETLFEPFKSKSIGNVRNPEGLGSDRSRYSTLARKASAVRVKS